MPVKKADQATPNLLLRQARLDRGWTQQEVANLIEAPHAFMINRWENGTTSPSSVYRQRLVTLFERDLESLGLLPSKCTSPVLYDPEIPLSFANEQRLIGREQLLADLQQQFCASKGQTRLALNGLPGVGKTALAVALARDHAIQKFFSDGILWVGLGPQPNLSTLLSRWGNLLGISQDEAAALRNQESWLEWLHCAIGTRQMLFVIDDAWVIENALTCLVGGPNRSYLLTTRLLDVALRFAGSRVIRVPELDQEASRQLLIQLTPTIAQVDDRTVQSLVQATGGLPLALTLLGQHLLVHAGQQTGRRLQRTLVHLQCLEDRVQLHRPQAGLQRDFRLPPGSSLSLQTIIGLSEAGLEPSTRQMLSALAVFPAKPGSFSEEAALFVAQGSVHDLDRLVDASLVEYLGQGRYSLHQTIADYIHTGCQNDAAQCQMATYYRDLLASHRHDYTLLEAETANITKGLQFALEHDLQEIFLQSVISFVPFLYDRGLHQVVTRYLVQAERIARSTHRYGALASLLQLSGQASFWLGNYEQAEQTYQEGLRLARERGNGKQICQLLFQLGRVARRRGMYEQAERYSQDGLELARELHEHETACTLLHNLGTLASERGAYPQANAFLSESLELARQIASEKLICKSLNNLAAIAAEQAQFALAEQFWQEVLPIVQNMRWYDQLSITFFNLGCLMRDQGKFSLAECYYQECLALDRKLANRERLGHILMELSALHRKQAAYEQARVYVQEGLELAQQGKHSKLLSKLYLEKGELALETGQLAEAEEAFREALEYVPTGEHAVNVGARYGLARVAALQDKLDEARCLGKACLEDFAASGYLRWEEVRAWLDSLPFE